MLPKLYKKTKTGAIQEWAIHVWTSDTDHSKYDVVTQFGQVDGQIQTTYDFISSGKNIGKSNETSVKEQAEFEAKARWTKQKKKGYVESLDDAKADKVDGIIEGGVSPMLAHNWDDHQDKIKFPAMVQPKLDGIRAVVIIDNEDVSIWSRTRKRITSMLHIEKAFKNLNLKGKHIFDGELFHLTIANTYRVFNIKGKDVLIDEEDIGKLNGYSIQILNNGYPGVSIQRKMNYIHRIVMGNPKGQVDHINRNKLDCRKSNLRVVNASQNTANTTKRKTNKSGYKGVVFFKRDSNWHAQITKDYKKIHIGYFESAEEAARAYDLKALELFGDSAVLNFPKDKRTISSFEDIVSAIRGESPNELSDQIQYHVYDYVGPGPFKERIELAHRLIEKDNAINLIPVDTMEIKYPEVITLHDFFVNKGYEGVMIRDANGLYEHRRSYGLLKCKVFTEEEFPIVGIQEGRGKLIGHVGSFTCKTDDGSEFQVKLEGSLGRLKELFENHSLWQNKKLTVQFQNKTAYGIPRFPVGKEIRDYE